MTTTRTQPEYRPNSDGTITLHLDGAAVPPFGQSADVRGLRTKSLRAQVLVALDSAMTLGAAHGPCDQQREIANALNGHPTPGHVTWHVERDAKRWTVLQVRDGETPVEILTGGAPNYVASDIANALERAYAVGGRYGRTGA